jgi:tellurite methyltransferase
MPASRTLEPPFAVRFFDEEFRKRIAEGTSELNPREATALPYVHGSVLDFGCGLGNLSLEAARRGCAVTSVDAGRVAVQRLRRESKRLGLRVRVVAADALDFEIDDLYDTVVSISLLMFFKRDDARALLARLQSGVAHGGVAVVSALAEGTTYVEMFDPQNHYLFGRHELASAFSGWTVLENRIEETVAPRSTTKTFSTIVARRP